MKEHHISMAIGGKAVLVTGADRRIGQALVTEALRCGTPSLRRPDSTSPPVGNLSRFIIRKDMKVRETSGQPVANVAAAARPWRAAGSTARLTGALAVTLGVAAACWVIAIRRMSGMDMGASTRLGSFGSFAVLWVVMMAAMMLPGATPAAVRRAKTSGRPLAAPLFAASYLAVWAAIGLAVYALDRPHGTVAAGVAAIAAGGYELTAAKRHCRRMCEDTVRSGWGFGLSCAGSSAGLMLVQVTAGVMSIAWMAGIGCLIAVQKLLPPRAAADVPVALALIGLGIVILIVPSAIPGLVPAMPTMPTM
jgi:predicted metal-binding membrane protein